MTMMDHWDPLRARLAVNEADGSFMVRADLRGLAVHELRVRVHRGDTLTISGVSIAEGEAWPFCRTVRLPTEVRTDRIDGRYDDGLLTLTLPKGQHARAIWTAPTAASQPHETGSGRVLVVEDDPCIRDVISMGLADEGYEVVTAPDGAAALDAVKKVPPDAILLDMWMPVMDGWEFARTYRELPGPHAPVIVVTAAPNAAERASQVDADAYLAKPFDIDEMLEVVGQYARPS